MNSFLSTPLRFPVKNSLICSDVFNFESLLLNSVQELAAFSSISTPAISFNTSFVFSMNSFFSGSLAFSVSILSVNSLCLLLIAV